MRPENSEYEKRIAKYFLILNLKKNISDSKQVNTNPNFKSGHLHFNIF